MSGDLSPATGSLGMCYALPVDAGAERSRHLESGGGGIRQSDTPQFGVPGLNQ